MARAHRLALALFVAAPACAQVSGRVTVLSDDIYRGQSLSDGKPSLQLAIAWDRGDGWYAGVQLSRVRFAEPDAPMRLRAVPYAGYVHVFGSPGISGEAGVQYNAFSRSGRYDFAEYYVGVSGERLHARLSWMPRYFGQSEAWSVDVSGDHPLRGRLRILGHIGALHLRRNPYYDDQAAWRGDASAGLGIDVAGFDLQATWNQATGGTRGIHCEPWQCRPRNGWVLRLSRSW